MSLSAISSDEYDVVVEERVGVRGDLVIDGLNTLDEFAEKTGLGVARRSVTRWLASSWPASGSCPASAMRFRSNSPRSSNDEERAPVELRVSS